MTAFRLKATDKSTGEHQIYGPWPHDETDPHRRTARIAFAMGFVSGVHSVHNGNPDDLSFEVLDGDEPPANNAVGTLHAYADATVTRKEDK